MHPIYAQGQSVGLLRLAAMTGYLALLDSKYVLSVRVEQLGINLTYRVRVSHWWLLTAGLAGLLFQHTFRKLVVRKAAECLVYCSSQVVIEYGRRN
jgi:hypothetical protein